MKTKPTHKNHASQTRLNAVAMFPLGRIVATPAVMSLFSQQTAMLTALLARHQSGDWGQVCSDDWQANDRALEEGWRILSVYELAGCRIWIITEADRSTTTLLLPEEY